MRRRHGPGYPQGRNAEECEEFIVIVLSARGPLALARPELPLPLDAQFLHSSSTTGTLASPLSTCVATQADFRRVDSRPSTGPLATAGVHAHKSSVMTSGGSPSHRDAYAQVALSTELVTRATQATGHSTSAGAQTGLHVPPTDRYDTRACPHDQNLWSVSVFGSLRADIFDFFRNSWGELEDDAGPDHVLWAAALAMAVASYGYGRGRDAPGGALPALIDGAFTELHEWRAEALEDERRLREERESEDVSDGDICGGEAVDAAHAAETEEAAARAEWTFSIAEAAARRSLAAEESTAFAEVLMGKHVCVVAAPARWYAPSLRPSSAAAAGTLASTQAIADSRHPADSATTGPLPIPKMRRLAALHRQADPESCRDNEAEGCAADVIRAAVVGTHEEVNRGEFSVHAPEGPPPGAPAVVTVA